MDITSFRTPGLGDQTHLLVHDGHGILVDPQRDISRFLDTAERQGVHVRFVLETHLHNDYVSGARDAARATGAELVLPAATAPAYRHTPAFHLEDITGPSGLTVRPLHTPGHTPEHTSYLILLDGEPAAVFSGGSLLVASAGRPDLLGPERARTLARLQHGSLRRLAGLPGDVRLLPTHGEGSFCTVTGAGRHTSTIADELTGNPLLAIPDAERFADQILAEPLPIPAFYRHMGPANLYGAPPMPPVSAPALRPEDLAALPEGTRLVDIRPRARQAAGILPGSTPVELRDDFGSWVGWLVPYGTPIALVADPGQDAEEALTQLARIGVDTVVGVLTDAGPAAALQTFELLELPAFAERLAAPDAQLLDVRAPGEHAAAPLPGAVHRYLPDLYAEGVPDRLDPARPVLVACGSGRRAAIATGPLLAEGHRPVVLTGAGVADLAGLRAA